MGADMTYRVSWDIDIDDAKSPMDAASKAHEIIRRPGTSANVYNVEAPDGVVTVAVPRAEMGQGVYTSLPMLVAEELDISWSAIRVEQAPIDSVYGNIVVMINSVPSSRGRRYWW